MSLLMWIKLVLPSPSTRAYSSLSKKDLDNTNKEVKHALEVGGSHNTSRYVQQLHTRGKGRDR